MKSCLQLSIFILLFSQPLLAEDWTGKGELGYVLVSGNTDSESFNMGLNFEKIQDKWKHSAKVSGIQAETDNITSSESYSFGWRSEYSLTKRAFTFADFRYFDDKFDSFVEIYTASLGFGYKVFDEESFAWDLSAGAGYRDTTIELTGEDISGVSYLLESDISYQITTTTSLENNTRIELTSDNTFVQNVAGLSVAINGSLALKLGYDVRYNSDPSPGFVNTDKIFSTNIVYSF